MALTIDNISVETLATLAAVSHGVQARTLAATTVSLTVADKTVQYFTGTTAGQILKMPAATTLAAGRRFEVHNSGTASVIVQDNAGTLLASVSPAATGVFTCDDASTTAGVWASNAEGSVVNVSVTDGTAFAFTATTDTLITGFTTTPVTGTYLVLASFNATIANNAVTAAFTFYKAGAAITTSKRQQKSAVSANLIIINLMEIIQVDGTQAVDLRASCTSGQLTIGQRTMLFVRIGD